MRFAGFPDQHPQIPKPPVSRFEHGFDVVGVLGTAWQTQGNAFAAVPKRTGFLVKESSADSAGVGIVPTDLVEDGGVLDGFRKRDGMFAPLPEQDRHQLTA
jgi:hypothetical protein